MSIKKALELLQESDTEAHAVAVKEVETLENKGQGVEAERKKAEDAKKDLDTANETHANEIKEWEKKVEKARDEGKQDTDGFKKLYNDLKEDYDKLVKTNGTSTEEVE